MWKKQQKQQKQRKICPLLKTPCVKENCEWWQGYYNHGVEKDQGWIDYNCAIKWISFLQIEQIMKGG